MEAEQRVVRRIAPDDADVDDDDADVRLDDASAANVAPSDEFLAYLGCYQM